MRNLISTLATSIIGTGIGGVTYIVVNTTTVTIVTNSSHETSTSTIKISSGSKININVGGEDSYVIHWTGKKGSQFTGSAAIMYPDGRPIKSYVVTKTLPHTYKISAIKNTAVSAMAVEPGVNVTILKNGVKCGEKTIEGNAIGDNQVCYSSNSSQKVNHDEKSVVFITTVLILILGQIILLLGILGVIFYVIDKVIDKYNLRIKFFSLKRLQNQGYRYKRHKSYHVPNRIPHKLLLMLNFDTSTAERLISHARNKYPGHSNNWYIEKVIRDLERDKR